MKIAVLLGGHSEEREVSLASGTQVARALRAAGHDVVAMDTAHGLLTLEEEEEILARGVRPDPPPLEVLGLLRTGDTTALTSSPELLEADLVFPALHGGAGEDGTLQALLDLTGLPYAGSGRLGCTLAMDKEVSKRLFRDEGIATPDWVAWSAEEARLWAGEEDGPELRAVGDRLGFPLIVKPPSGGSTLGLTLARTPESLEAAVHEALRYEARVLFEAYVKGRELTVGIVGNDALPVGEIKPAHELFDYECKYQPGLAEEIFPAEIPSGVALELQESALAAHRVLQLSDFSRVDFLVDEDGEAWCLEANALPGLTSNSLLPKAARAAGTSFPELCDQVVRVALARWGIQGALPGTRTFSGG